MIKKAVPQSEALPLHSGLANLYDHLKYGDSGGSDKLHSWYSLRRIYLDTVLVNRTSPLFFRFFLSTLSFLHHLSY